MALKTGTSGQEIAAWAGKNGFQRLSDDAYRSEFGGGAVVVELKRASIVTFLEQDGELRILASTRYGDLAFDGDGMLRGAGLCSRVVEEAVKGDVPIWFPSRNAACSARK
jgi:hypothetical protein